jgi:hypothetical protein
MTLQPQKTINELRDEYTESVYPGQLPASPLPAPPASDDRHVTPAPPDVLPIEDSQLTFTAADLLASSAGLEGFRLIDTSVSILGAHGTVTANTDESWTLDPSPHVHGQDVPVFFDVVDAGGHAMSRSALVDVPDANTAPEAGDVNLGQCMAGGGRIFTTFDLLSASHDADGDILSVANVQTDPECGSVRSLGNNYWLFTPARGFAGSAEISFEVRDGAAASEAVAALEVLPAGDNRPPIVSLANLGHTLEDTSFLITQSRLLFGSRDPDGDRLHVASVSVDEACGTVRDNGDGTWTFTPSENFNGDDVRIGFMVSDGRGGEAASTALLDVRPVNDAPEVGDVRLGTMNEDTTLTVTAAQLLLKAGDIDGDRIHVASVTADPAVGTVTDNGDGTWTFTPAENLNGNGVPLTFSVDDGHGGSASAQATVDILPVNDAPRAGDISIIIDEDTPAEITQELIRAHCSDVDGDTVTAITMSLQTPGILSEEISMSGEARTWEFRPHDNFEGQASIAYTISDGQAQDVGRIDVTVNAVADPLNATHTVAGYTGGLYELNLDFSAQFPEQDGSEVYTVLSLSGLDGIPAGAQLLDGDTVIWTSGDGDTLSLTPEQAMGIDSIWLRCHEEGSFDITVHTRTVELSNNDTAIGASTLHFDIDTPPQLATYDIADTDPSMPGVFWYQNGPDTSAPSDVAFSSASDKARFMTFANNPILFNNLDPADPDAIINSVNWYADAANTIEIEGFSTEFNHVPDPNNPEVAYPQSHSHGAMHDIWMFRWNMADQGNQDLHFSPHLRQQLGDQSMQVVAHNVQNGIDFFEARSVIMGYMNEALWLQHQTFLDIFKIESATHPEYLRAGWDDRFLFGTDDGNDVLRGEDAPGGDAGNNVLVGFGGDDTLIYGEGNDSLFGGDGNDSLVIDTEHHNGLLDSYALTGFVIPTVGTNFAAPGEYGFYTVTEGKIDGGDGYDVLSLGAQEQAAGCNTLRLDYFEHWIGNEPPTYSMGIFNKTTNTYYCHWEATFPNNSPLMAGETIGNYASFKYHLINIEEIDISGDADDANTLNLNLANVWLVTSNEYGKTLYVTGDTNDTLEIRDQANWRYVDSDADHHHLVSSNGLAELYVDTDVDIHVVGGTDYGYRNPTWTSSSQKQTPSNDDLHVDGFFHTVLSGGGNDTVTIDPDLFHDDKRIDASDFSHIDGGSGYDVLKLGANHALLSGAEFDLTSFAPDYDVRQPVPNMWPVRNHADGILNIEAIDITGAAHQDNTLTLDASSVIDCTDSDNILYVRGDAGDTVHATDASQWTYTQSTEMGGVTYDHYVGADLVGVFANLYVEHQLQTNLEHP